MLPDAIIPSDEELDPDLSNFKPLGPVVGGADSFGDSPPFGVPFEDLPGVTVQQNPAPAGSSGAMTRNHGDDTGAKNLQTATPADLLNDWNDIFFGDFDPVDVW